jgi:LPXTG-site transpeptidase (sortase) family protein
VRVVVAVGLAVLTFAGVSVLGLGHLVTALSTADDAAQTRIAQQQLARQVPASAVDHGLAGQPVVARPEGAGGAGPPDGADTAADRSHGQHAATPVASPVGVGQALSVMRIPRFGHDWRWVALEGTADWVIASGPGHYPWTPLPGQQGNVGFAAHRAGHGDPFIDFDGLRPGDRVILSQGGTRWVYRLDMRPRIIATSASWVLNPLRGHRLTLTTCWPKYGSAKRMYVRGHLVRAGGPS